MSKGNEGQASARRALRAIFLLQGHTFEGLRLKQLAESMQTTPSTALRTLEILADEGIAERIPGRDEFWRLSPRIVQLARAHALELERHRSVLDEFEQRYSRDPN